MKQFGKVVRTLGRALIVGVPATGADGRQVPQTFVLEGRCEHFCDFRKCRLALFLNIKSTRYFFSLNTINLSAKKN